MKVDYSLILKGIEFVIDHKDEITTAVKEGKDLVDWLREKFAGHEALTEVERALLVMSIDTLVKIQIVNEGQAPPLTPPPAPPVIDPTTVKYVYLDEAIKHTSEAYPFVIELEPDYGEGDVGIIRFIVWPPVGPFPGKKVYPT